MSKEDKANEFIEGLPRPKYFPLLDGIAKESFIRGYEEAIEDAITKFKANTFDSEVGNTYIYRILKEFEKLKK